MSPRVSIRLLSTQSDQRLLALARDGHERAFEALVHRYRRPLLRYCRRMGLTETRAEDVLQQALLRAWLALSRRARVRDLKPWLYRIVHNTAVNAIRRAADAEGRLTEVTETEVVVGRESELERKIAMRDALTDVAALPQMQRQAIFLTAVDGQSHDEVASALGISHGALRGLLYRARTTLRGAAAAVTPTPLIEWISRGSGGAGPAADRLAELTSGGGAAGISGLLLKGAVVAVTAGAVATSASVVEHHGHHKPAGTGLHASSRELAGPVNGALPPARRMAAVTTTGAPLPASVGEQPATVHRRRGARNSHHDRSAHAGPDDDIAITPIDGDLRGTRHGSRQQDTGARHDAGDDQPSAGASAGERDTGDRLRGDAGDATGDRSSHRGSRDRGPTSGESSGGKSGGSSEAISASSGASGSAPVQATVTVSTGSVGDDQAVTDKAGSDGHEGRDGSSSGSGSGS